MVARISVMRTACRCAIASASLFDIVVGGLRDHEVGTASGLLQALQQLGAALGVAAIGTAFFGALGSDSDRARDFLQAAELTTLLTVGLLALAFAIGFLM